MLIFGIDPGIAIVGYCGLSIGERVPKIETWGSIQTEKTLTVSRRLLEIHQDIKYLLEKFRPDALAIEELYFFKNAKTLTPVLEARGVILMTAEMFNIPIFEYTPLVVKQVITGYGRAEKDDVRDMLLHQLELEPQKMLDDVIDAAAIAYCHYRRL